MAQKLLILQGIPASGKSTYAKDLCMKDKSFIRVNRDAVRDMLRSGYQFGVGVLEDVTTETCKSAAKAALDNGMSVICDDTNLNVKTINSWKALADSYGINDKSGKQKVSFEVDSQFLHTSVDVCVERDSKRIQGRVGETVIRSFGFRNNLTMFDKINLVLVDLDGTIADIEERRKASTKEDGKINYGKFFDPELIKNDNPRKDIMDEAKEFAEANDASILIVSGRSSGDKNRPYQAYDATRKWLQENNFNYPMLIRNANDYRNDVILKQEFYNMIIKSGYKVIKCFDDRRCVVEMWRSNGLNVRVCDIGDPINGGDF